MKAMITQKRGVTIVHFEGALDFSYSEEIQKKISELYNAKRNQKIIFDLSGLKFIGSSGLKDFIEMCKQFNKKQTKPRFIGLSNEYQKLFKAYEGDKSFSIFESEPAALKSYRKPMWHKKGSA
ncbi:MAG: STAS domain-containing protein [Deltaproteobacteria bacterium]|nr:STAS domain-containing protein [Deltaproteobacteria bacterium]